MGWLNTFLAAACSAYMFSTAACTADVVAGFVMLTYVVVNGYILSVKAKS